MLALPWSPDLPALYAVRAILSSPEAEALDERHETFGFRRIETRDGALHLNGRPLYLRGADAAPFYKWVREQRRWEPQWNFSKVLIGRDGAIVGTYGSSDPPDRGTVRIALDAALRRPEA